MGNRLLSERLGYSSTYQLTAEIEDRHPQGTALAHSLGLLYSAFTYYTGFKVNSGEYKVMGLAPCGEPKYVQLILDEVIDLTEDGSLRLNQEYFNYLGGLTMTSAKFDMLFGGPARIPETPLTQREMDSARSVQDVCEEAMLRMVNAIHRETRLLAKAWSTAFLDVSHRA